MCCSVVRDFIHFPIYWQSYSLYSSNRLPIFLFSIINISLFFVVVLLLFHSFFVYCVLCTHVLCVLMWQHEWNTFIWNSSIRTRFCFHPSIQQRKDKHLNHHVILFNKNYLLMLFLTCWRWLYIYKSSNWCECMIYICPSIWCSYSINPSIHHHSGDWYCPTHFNLMKEIKKMVDEQHFDCLPYHHFIQWRERERSRMNRIRCELLRCGYYYKFRMHSSAQLTSTIPIDRIHWWTL